MVSRAHTLHLFCIFSLIAWPSCVPTEDLRGGTGPGSGVVECIEDDECGAEELCSELGVCTGILSCEDDEACGLSEICVEQICQAAPGCQSDDDCDSGFFCSDDPNTSCIADGECRVEADCGEGTFCSAVDRCIADNTCFSRSDCDPGQKCVDMECVAGDGCGGESVVIDPIDPRVLVLLDRSKSMTGKVPSGNGENERKWVIAARATEALVQSPSLSDQIDWGLRLFPQARPSNQGVRNDQTRCVLDDALMPVGSEPDAIASELNAITNPDHLEYPGWPQVTNLNVVTHVAIDEPAFVDSLLEARGVNNVILITDGKQRRCDNEVPGSAAENIAALLTKNIRTYVIGFGGFSNTDELEAMAVAGQESSRQPKHYLAENEAELQQALAEITAQIVTCDIVLDSPPDDPSEMAVFLNSVDPLPRDVPDGWTYVVEHDVETGITVFKVVLQGAACNAWSMGDLDNSGDVDDDERNTPRDLQVVFGCPDPDVN